MRESRGWDSLWSARGGVRVRVCMRCTRRWNKLPCLSILFPSFNFSLENGKSFDSWEMIFGDYAKGCSGLWHRGVSDTRIASTRRPDGPKNRERIFTFSSEFPCRLSLKCPSGVFASRTFYFLITRSRPVTRRTLKFTSNLKLPNFSEKQKTFFFPFSVEQHKEGEKNGWEKNYQQVIFRLSFPVFFTDTEKRRGNLWSRACLCPFYCLFWFFCSHSFDTIFKNFLALGWKN